MDILYISDKYPTDDNPYTSFISTICNEFVRQGHNVTVVSPCSITTQLRHKWKIPPLRNQFRVTRKDNTTGYVNVYRPRYISLGQSPATAKVSFLLRAITLNRFLNKHRIKADIIYAKFFAAAVDATEYADKNGLPVFVDSGEDRIFLEKFFSKGRISRFKQVLRGVVCVSSKNKQECIAKGLANENNTRVCVNGYDATRFYPVDKTLAREKLGFSQEPFIVVFCGRFNNRKGVMRVDEAVRGLNDPNVKCIYIGSVVEKSDVDLKGDHILFSGSIPHNEVAAYLSCGDVYVFPSLMEGCPNSTIEAMACGLPIISSDRDFNHDILDKNNSLLINPDSIEDIATAIAKIKNDNELRVWLAKASLVKAEELSIESRVNKIIDFIKESCKINK